MKLKIFFYLFSLLSAVNITAQVFLNLDFEKYTANGKPTKWNVYGEGYLIQVDTTIFYSGKSSLCIQREGKGSYEKVSSFFPIDGVRGKTLKLSGYIKTKNISYGYAGLWLSINGNSEHKKYDNMLDKGPKGTTNWKKYSVSLKVDQTATNIIFGVALPGDGKAWFDKLQFEVDGKLYDQKYPQELSISVDNINWLKTNIDTFMTSDPKHDNSDLEFLNSMVGKAKIVSLGEGTHGTSEFFKMKHRILKYLAEEMGFTVFAIEANMPEAKAVNDYILNGVGDPKKVLEGLYFWTWNTEEVLEMIEWMREFNKSKRGRIEFWGFDLQIPHMAIENVKKFLAEHDSIYFSTANSNYAKIIETMNEVRRKKSKLDNVLAEPILNYATEVFNYIENKSSFYQEIVSKDEIEWVKQNARIIVQSVECMMENKVSRDENMAINIEWILNRFGKDAKIVLWAHNGHVSKSPTTYSYKPMGYYLDHKYGKDMVVFGFGFYKGDYTAVGAKGLSNYSTSLPQNGSFEWILHNTTKNQFIIDLRKFPNSPFSSLLNDEIEFRSIGAMAMEEAFYPTKIAQEYDALIYFENTTPSDCFNKKNK